MFDPQFRVIHKAITPDLAYTVAEWKGIEHTVEPTANGHSADVHMAITHVGPDDTSVTPKG
jgi:hypothetical protein